MLSYCKKHPVIARTAEQDEATQTQPRNGLLGCFVTTFLAMTVLVDVPPLWGGTCWDNFNLKYYSSDGFQPLGSNNNGWKPSLLYRTTPS